MAPKLSVPDDAEERTPLLAHCNEDIHAASAAQHSDTASTSPAWCESQLNTDLDAKLRRWRDAISKRFTTDPPAVSGAARRGSGASDSPLPAKVPAAVLSIYGMGGVDLAADLLDEPPMPCVPRSDGDEPARSAHILAVSSQVRTSTAYHTPRAADGAQFLAEIGAVRSAIRQGVQPKMIAKGSSGSYFARARVPIPNDADSGNESDTESDGGERYVTMTVGVFKPKDEEPYGNLNPKRQFLRKYFWWAMGRACLLPNFSYLSEAGASFLDDMLGLHIVPATRLVTLSSPAFYYTYADRQAFVNAGGLAGGGTLPEKIGSYQQFLHGFVNMSDFLRANPWPSRADTRLLERDMKEELAAHRKARRKSKARLRHCFTAAKYLLLCRGKHVTSPAEEARQRERGLERDRANGNHLAPPPSHGEGSSQTASSHTPPMSAHVPAEEFTWTPALMDSFRLQLEQLVVLDYLMRNTDRGLDNAMVRCVYTNSGGLEMKIGAIDSSLSFPHAHPAGMREYPFGWLWLPVDMIGRPFSRGLRERLLPLLLNPQWWMELSTGLRQIFATDEFFDESLFQKQIAVLKGQACNLIMSLQSPGDGPIELCARMKKLVKTDMRDMSPGELFAQCLGVDRSDDQWLSDTAFVLDADLAKLALRYAQTLGKPNPTPPSLAQQADLLRLSTSSPPLEHDTEPIQPTAAARGIDVLDRMERAHEPSHNMAHSLHLGRARPHAEQQDDPPLSTSVASLPPVRPQSATFSSSGRKRRKSSSSWGRFVHRFSLPHPTPHPTREEPGPLRVAVERVVDDSSRALIWWY